MADSGRPAIVIAASGMCAGGRMMNYLQALLGDERTDVVFVGYQAVGTPGRDKSTLITTISTGENGSFTASTENLGRPAKLVDQDFRAVVEFEIPEIES